MNKIIQIIPILLCIQMYAQDLTSPRTQWQTKLWNFKDIQTLWLMRKRDMLEIKKNTLENKRRSNLRTAVKMIAQYHNPNSNLTTKEREKLGKDIDILDANKDTLFAYDTKLKKDVEAMQKDLNRLDNTIEKRILDAEVKKNTPGRWSNWVRNWSNWARK